MSAGLMTADPVYVSYFRKVLQLLLSRGGVYIPETIELGQVDNYISKKFVPSEADELVKKWETHPHDKPGWLMQRTQPVQIAIMMSKLARDFNFVNINVERAYLDSDERIRELLMLMEELYDVLHPAYGDVRIEEMIRLQDHPLGKMRPGTDLLRGLPDIYWANFLGPEYVQMFGVDKVLSAPAYSVRALSDGGALVVLSPSPFDYLIDPETFERRRQELKTYLGVDAFDTGDLSHRGKIPKFRYFEDGKRTISSTHSEPASSLSHDWLSQVSKEDWEKWLQDNQSLAAEFVGEMSSLGVVLDSSEKSLSILDAYIRSLHKSEATPSMDTLMKVAAYVSQMVIRNTGASWSFRASEDQPSLRLGDIQVSPLARTQKVLQENETFEHWYRFITRELVPLVRSSKTTV